MSEIATFGAGCFWCVEAVFQQLQGVESVESGYMGGKTADPTYREVCSGLSGHAEVIRIRFNPKEISYSDLLNVLWASHDPTTLNRQGHDRGTQYRSVVFYHSEEQRKVAEESKQSVATQLYDNPVVTEITEASTFYPAEAYHQNFYQDNPNHGYCRAVIDPKMVKFRNKFTHLLKKENLEEKST